MAKEWFIDRRSWKAQKPNAYSTHTQRTQRVERVVLNG